MFVYEFLYRGRAADDVAPPAWHVILADSVTDIFGNPQFARSDALTPEAANALGFDLPTIIDVINTSVMAQLSALQTQHSALQAELAATKQASTLGAVSVAADVPL